MKGRRRPPPPPPTYITLFHDSLLDMRKWKWLLYRHSVKYTSYPAVKKDHQKAKADENNQSHEQKSAHHGEVILSRTEHI